MDKSLVDLYEGDKLLGILDVMFNDHFVDLREEVSGKMTISHFSTPSERCLPLAVLHTISATAVCLKAECGKTDNHLITQLHFECLLGNKTAVVSLGDEELHLVAMRSREKHLSPCFWGFTVASGLYKSSCDMLNRRCLGIVFDLDETLIVANTLRSFDIRIENLQRKIRSEVDLQRVTRMLAAVKRYEDDRNILKEYAKSDQVDENGKAIKAQPEVILALSDNHQTLVRPVLRLQDNSIVLTRINPLDRDTSVLVKLRPGWEDLRSYLTDRGRKRFEVYVCTMGEKEYALEMWRLLDPDSKLINSDELLNRIVCVKPGLKKSICDVFQDRDCHPKMTLVIDDRLKVWGEKDQPRLHIVPAFTPYSAPQAEVNDDVPILSAARNVACNVRGGFFKDFDDGFLLQIDGIAYEDEIKDIISPDVSNYLTSEHDTADLNLDREPLGFDGVIDVELEKRLKEAIVSSIAPPTMRSRDPRLKSTSQQNRAPVSEPFVPPKISEPMVHIEHEEETKDLISPDVSNYLTSEDNTADLNVDREALGFDGVRDVELITTLKEGIVSSIAPSTMRSRDPRLKTTSQQNTTPVSEPFVPPTISEPMVQYPSTQLPEETLILQHLTEVNLPKTSLHNSPTREEGELSESESDTVRRLHSLQDGTDTSVHVGSGPQLSVKPQMRIQPHRGWFPEQEEINLRQLNRGAPSKRSPYHPESLHKKPQPLDEAPFIRKSLQMDDRLRNHEPPSSWSFPDDKCSPGSEGDESDAYDESPAEYLHTISVKCGAKVEFWPTLVPCTELQFSVEVRFAGERIGEGIGRTRREAQHQAATESLMNLAEEYLSVLEPGTTSVYGDDIRVSENEKGFFSDANPSSTVSERARVLDSRMKVSNKGLITALKKLCMKKGLDLSFHEPRILRTNEVHAQVEINGKVLGKGKGLTWDEAKMQAAHWAYKRMTSWTGQYPRKRTTPPRSYQQMPCKRFRR